MSPKRKDPPEPFKDSRWVGPDDSEYETEIIKVKAPYIYADALCNCRVRLALVGPSIVEREVRRAKQFKFLLPTVDESRSEEDLARTDTDEQHDKILFELEFKKLKLADKLLRKYKSLEPAEAEAKAEAEYDALKRNFEGMILRYATLKKNPKPAESERRAMLKECEKAARKLKDKIELDDLSIDLIDEQMFPSGGYADFKKLLEGFVIGIETVVRETEPIRRGPRAKKLNAAAAEEIQDLMKKYELKPSVYKKGIWVGLLRILFDAIGETKADPMNYIRQIYQQDVR